MDLGQVGIWSGDLRSGDPGEVAEAAAELEELGVGALWFPGGAGGDDVLDVAERLLAATSRVVVGTGILNVWMHDPDVVAARHAALTDTYGHRFMLGLGVSHAVLVDRDEPGRWTRPLSVVSDYLDRLDATARPVAPADRCLAALGPRMLELARDRTAGSHPYLAPPAHTRMAREALGDGPLLAPDQAVLFEADPDTARTMARAVLAFPTKLPNYRNNLVRAGFTDDDLVDGGSDRLVDTLVAWGSSDAVATHVQDHLAAGASHVALRVIGTPQGSLPRQEWRTALDAVRPLLRP